MNTKTMTKKQKATEAAIQLGIKVKPSWTEKQIVAAIEKAGLESSKEAKKAKDENKKALNIISAIDALAKLKSEGVEVKPFLRNSRVVRIDENKGRLNNAQWATLQNVHKAIKALNPNVPHKATFIIHPSGSIALYSKLG